MAQAADASKYPDWMAQWQNKSGGHFDASKPRMKQEAPLTPEYQAIYEANLADMANGGIDHRDRIVLCRHRPLRCARGGQRIP